MKHKISIFIITYNEAHIIAKCLEKLKTFDEIIVVDSGSTDATVSICESFGAKVISHKFENFGLQKQFALEQTTHNWVLSLDADEVLSDALISEIHNINHQENVKAYTIPRTHVFLNKIFKNGAESKRPILRLFNKNFGNHDLGSTEGVTRFKIVLLTFFKLQEICYERRCPRLRSHHN